jgi:hypothetical protein
MPRTVEWGNQLKSHVGSTVIRLARGVTVRSGDRRHRAGMTNLDLTRDLARLDALVTTKDHAAVEALLTELHIAYHDRPRDHIRVHLAWMRVHAKRHSYLRAAFHAFAGLVVAGPASLVQRYTGVVAPAFNAERR